MDDPALVVRKSEPRFVKLEVRTWEHAALHPATNGITADILTSARLLPSDVTDLIYTALGEEWNSVLRFTEPFPPLKLRLIRDPRQIERVQPALFERASDSILNIKFGDAFINWSSKVLSALDGKSIDADIAGRNARFGKLPGDDSIIGHYYNIDIVTVIGSSIDTSITEHDRLMPWASTDLCPPGLLRNLQDLLVR